MRSEKKLAYQQHLIETLKKQIEELKQENLVLSYQLEANKTLLLSKESTLDNKEAQLDESRKVYERLISELDASKKKYEQITLELRQMKEKYVAEMKRQLRRISHQK